MTIVAWHTSYFSSKNLSFAAIFQQGKLRWTKKYVYLCGHNLK